MRLLATTHDPWGRPVLLTAERWEHILDNHPEMWRWRPHILTTVLRPNVITPDPKIRRWRYWNTAVGRSSWLLVVVDWNCAPARIITAYSRRKGPL